MAVLPSFFFGVDAYAIDWMRCGRAHREIRLSSFVTTAASLIRRRTAAQLADCEHIKIRTTKACVSGQLLQHRTELSGAGAVRLGISGINNTLASWAGSTPKIMNQHAADVARFTGAGRSKYSSSNQLSALQRGDLERLRRRHQIESGIENCVAVNASILGTS